MALVIAQTTLLGTVGMLTLAIGHLGRAQTLEEAVTHAHSVADSLANGAIAGQGADSSGSFRLAWTVDSIGGFVITVRAPKGDSLVFEGRTRR